MSACPSLTINLKVQCTWKMVFSSLKLHIHTGTTDLPLCYHGNKNINSFNSTVEVKIKHCNFSMIQSKFSSKTYLAYSIFWSLGTLSPTKSNNHSTALLLNTSKNFKSTIKKTQNLLGFNKSADNILSLLVAQCWHHSATTPTILGKPYCCKGAARWS